MRHLQSHFVCARPFAFCAMAITFPSGPATRAITILEGRVASRTAELGLHPLSGWFFYAALARGTD